jgi:hypothetical protein
MPVQVDVEIVRPRPEALAGVVPADPRWRRVQRRELVGGRRRVDERREQLRGWFRGRRLRRRAVSRHVRFGRSHELAERFRAGDEVGARVAARVEMSLDLGRGCKPPRRGSDLDDDFSTVDEDDGDDLGQVTRAERLAGRSGSEERHAPPL